VVALAAAAVWPGPAPAGGVHQRTQASVTSTERCEYRILQGKEEKGREIVEKRVFSNNTVAFLIEATMTYGPGLTMSQHIELTVEEESFFPRTLHIRKQVMQPDSTSFEQRVDVELFSNVAVVTSRLNNQENSRRVVVPTGLAMSDVGVLGYLYQFLFWYDRESGGGQRFEWLDPVTVNINGGEIKWAKEETIPVLGKKTRVDVFMLERDKIGPATVWVDARGDIVRGEQNQFVFELLSRKKS
jgi:hypothetical protein